MKTPVFDPPLSGFQELQHDLVNNNLQGLFGSSTKYSSAAFVLERNSYETDSESAVRVWYLEGDTQTMSAP